MLEQLHMSEDDLGEGDALVRKEGNSLKRLVPFSEPMGSER